MSRERLDRSLPPPPGALRPFAFPAFERYRLAGGLEVFLGPRPGSRLACLELLIDAGAEHDPADGPGLAALTAAMLDEGSTQRSGPEIADAIELLGGSLGTSADWNGAQASVALLAEHLETGSTLLDEVARRPAFPVREVDRLRHQTLAELLRRRDQPASVADEVLSRVLYDGTVYQHPLIGTEEAVRRFRPEELAAFHQARAASRRAALVAVGDFTLATGAETIERLFGDWPAATTTPAPLVSPPPRAGVSVHIVDRPGAAQTEIRLGHASVPRRHPDRPALAVMNSILGGKFTSRINLNLRERHGYTYGASSRFVDRRGPGPFVIGAAVATESTAAALRETLGELGRIRDALVEPQELADAISYLVGVFPYTLQTDQDFALRLAELAVYDLPSTYYEDHLRAIARVDRDAVRRVAREHLEVEKLAIVAVGPAAELRPQLAELGEPSVVTERG